MVRLEENMMGQLYGSTFPINPQQGAEENIELGLLIKLILNSKNISLPGLVKHVQVVGIDVNSPSFSGKSIYRTSDDPYRLSLKDVLIVGFILSIWFYSLYRFFKIWRDILNFSAESLQRSQNPPDNFWTWAISYLRSLKKSKISGEEVVISRYSPTPVDQARRAKAIVERQKELMARRKARQRPRGIELEMLEKQMLEDGQDDEQQATMSSPAEPNQPQTAFQCISETEPAYQTHSTSLCQQEALCQSHQIKSNAINSDSMEGLVRVEGEEHHSDVHPASVLPGIMFKAKREPLAGQVNALFVADSVADVLSEGGDPVAPEANTVKGCGGGKTITKAEMHFKQGKMTAGELKRLLRSEEAAKSKRISRSLSLSSGSCDDLTRSELLDKSSSRGSVGERRFPTRSSVKVGRIDKSHQKQQSPLRKKTKDSRSSFRCRYKEVNI